MIRFNDDSKGIKKQRCKHKIVDARNETGSVEVGADESLAAKERCKQTKAEQMKRIPH